MPDSVSQNATGSGAKSDVVTDKPLRPPIEHELMFALVSAILTQDTSNIGATALTLIGTAVAIARHVEPKRRKFIAAYAREQIDEMSEVIQ